MSDNDKELVIVDKGIVYPVVQPERKRYQRTTKKEIHDFVRWLFKHNTDEAFNKLSNAKVANMYFVESGVYINRETIRRNRNLWHVVDNKIVNSENRFTTVSTEEQK